MDDEDICVECYELLEECTCGKCEGCGEHSAYCICDLLEEY